MIEIGSFIKLQRTKQDMTLGDLADGIVSVSYLSKIENLKTQASPEIIQLLCNRLGIQVDNSEEQAIKEKCKEWYSMLFKVNDKEKIIATYKEIQEMMDTNLSENLLMFEIHKIRYYLILNQYDKALKKINELSEISDNFDNLQDFYWNKFRGNYYSLANVDYHQAMFYYKKSEEKIMHIDIGEDEAADLKYIIAVTHSELRNTLESIDYANQALAVFMKQYNFHRCAQCHIVLGISYRRIKMYEKAIKNYNLAKHLAELNNNKQVNQQTTYNLGNLYSTIGESEEAIKYYSEVVEDNEVHLHEKLIAITSLIKEYYKIGNIDKTREMINEAKALLDSVKNSVYYQLYYYIIYTYTYKLNGEDDRFKSLVKDKFIPYLRKNKDYGNLVAYSNMLANHFESIGRYKESVKYYKLANETYEKLINL
ncbi:helix-turn-helix domain-containing protein [Oceanobacillus halophilus]|uniref:Helix-turn-helix domain-containing protein n=1 Tax=Oceanobacillus halophilus TaxID=930130 RepID=A0A495A609_9BACI|nr:helix-turn-helix domain-containing protein [Oceanobacillus halophilus]RKQ34624.1 helix-turn-helix domain-containing protein [Oceanobacillus halophilus]